MSVISTCALRAFRSTDTMRRDDARERTSVFRALRGAVPALAAVVATVFSLHAHASSATPADASATAANTAVTSDGAAGAYPQRAMTLIVPFPAGGPADIVARLYAQQLSELTGQSVVVENPAGAGGTIGTRAAAQAKPDGYTLLFGTTSTMVINQLIMNNIPYDFDRDFTVLGLIANAPHVLAVRGNFPAQDVKTLVEMARKDPGKYSFASSGVGTIVQMGAELFRLENDIDLLHVPYKGGGPATLALVSGDVDMTVNDMTTLKPLIADNRLRPLAVLHDQRLSLLPDVPTFAELGKPSVHSSTWWGLAVRSDTPKEIQEALRELHTKVIRNEKYKERLAEMAVETLDLPPEQTAAFMQQEKEKWARVVKEANISTN